MDKILERVKSYIKVIGIGSSWLNVMLVFLICLDVFMRYLFNQSYNWILELEWHLFGLIFLWLIIAIRGILPRFRYNQLMDIGWKSFLPFSLSFFLFYFILFILFL